MRLPYDYGILPRYCGAFVEALAAATPDPARIVEIGTYHGNSLVALLRGTFLHDDVHIWTVDVSECPDADELVGKALLPADRYNRIVGESSVIAAGWDTPLDLVRIDGDHSEEGTRADIQAWAPHLKPGGIMAFDDFETPEWPGVTKAIDALMFSRSNEWRLIGQLGRNIAFEKIQGVAPWQQAIGHWRQFWPETVDWHNETLSVPLWRWVNFGWSWSGYPELPPEQWQARGQEPPQDPLATVPTEKLTEEQIASLSERDKAIRGLEYSTTIYDREWFGKQKWQHHWIQKVMGWMVGEFGRFESSLDLGAGDGYYSYVLREMKTEAYAVEVDEVAAEFTPEEVWFVPWDLRNPLDLKRAYDLVLCLEVAEHLPEASADTLCDTIGRHCGKLLLFTAAPPKQGGHGHVNCQPEAYWIEKLGRRGLAHWDEGTARARRAWENILGESLPWLWKNVMIFVRG